MRCCPAVVPGGWGPEADPRSCLTTRGAKRSGWRCLQRWEQKGCARQPKGILPCELCAHCAASPASPAGQDGRRSEEHTSELQSRGHLVCRLLLEKKRAKQTTYRS